MGTRGARPAAAGRADVPRRVFLGWDGRPPGAASGAAWRSRLDRAAEWIAGDLVEQRGADLASVAIALPGRRAARRLEQLVARRLADRGAAFVPARFVTVGRLVDHLLARPRPTAGRLARTLAWGAALAACPTEDLTDLLARPPEADDGLGRHRLAAELRGFHGRLAPEGLDFAAVRDALADTPDARRWDVLARLARAYRARLADLGLDDPHDLRRAAVDRGELDATGRVVLVGAVELNDLTRRALAVLGSRVDALVFAPSGLADRFDAFGAVEVEAWADAEVDLDAARWHVESGPGDQAEAAIGLLAGWGRRYSPAQVTLGVADREVVPEFEARLPDRGVAARSAAGRALGDTAPWRLLAAVAAWRGGGRFADLAALVRHPDLHLRLAQALETDPAVACDGYAREHLPGPVPDRWLDGPDAPVLARLVACLDAWFADLPSGVDPVSLRATATGALQALRRVYGGATLEVDARPEDRRLAGALAALRDAFLEVEGGPGPLVERPFGASATTLELILHDCAGEPVPPAADEDAIELLGWLELPLDDAPALVVTGFNGGRVPAAPTGDAFLSDAVRRALGLPEERARRARDAYLLALLVHSRDELHLVSGRRTRQGDPLRPSRLVFHRPEDEVPALVARFVAGGRARRVRGVAPESAADDGRGSRPLPRLAPLTHISVTAFRDHLRSPYLYALRHGAGLGSIDDGALELDGSRFGILAHEVLRRLDGEGDVSRSTDADEISRFLLAQLRSCARESFAGAALPAVAVQLEQLAARMARFARWQAARVEDGWEILAVEWAPTAEAWGRAGDPPDGRVDGSVPFDVDGEVIALRGRIDRIDVQPASGAWALLDYKTSDAGKPPRAVHGPRRGSGRWDDLQLPLYRLLCRPVPSDWVARGVDASREPQLGYLNLSREVKEGSDKVLQPGEWSADELADAEHEARRVVRDIRGGAFPVGNFPDDDPILAAVAGIGILSGQPEDADVDDDEEDGE